MDAFLSALTIFVLALYVGFELIGKVPPTLHTPLLSGANAVSGVTLIAALMTAGAKRTPLAGALGFVAVLLATINIVSGFMVTHRMLRLFKRR
jgi:H+-translocating NAD(P) transhydrogenase subunit alpha